VFTLSYFFYSNNLLIIFVVKIKIEQLEFYV